MLTTIAKALHLDPYGNLRSDHTVARLRKALSPRYLVARVAKTLYERRHPDHPWIARRAVEWLEANLRPTFRGAEWGTGDGTAWLARRSASLVSVEHHAAWADRVRADLARRGVTNVDYRLVAEDRYAAALDDLEDGSLDYVLVDGLFRDHALIHSIPKLRPGGFIVFDNANWFLPSESPTPHSRSLADGPAPGKYAEAVATLARWRRLWMTDGVNDTVIFTKPEE